nr:MAG TPA: hypothetical protein [Caudoviricetes sp.]
MGLFLSPFLFSFLYSYLFLFLFLSLLDHPLPRRRPVGAPSEIREKLGQEPLLAGCHNVSCAALE